MLFIDIPERDIPQAEYFDNRKQEFITIESRHIDAIHLKLEHSLMSISKWESKWHQPFLGREQFGGEELLDYIRCMTINPPRNPKIYEDLTKEAVESIITYMEDAQSAWEMRKTKPTKRKKRRPDTTESIYYAMIQYGIPLECEQWHFNRLMALIDYCDYMGGSVSGAGGQRKRSEREVMEMYRAMNDRNRKKYNSKG